MCKKLKNLPEMAKKGGTGWKKGLKKVEKGVQRVAKDGKNPRPRKLKEPKAPKIKTTNKSSPWVRQPGLRTGP